MLKSSESDRVLVVFVQTDTLDASNAVAAKEYFKALDLTNVDRAVLDLSAVGFMDSSGIGAILSFYKLTDQKLVLKNPTPTVMSVLELLRLHRIFEIESD